MVYLKKMVLLLLFCFVISSLQSQEPMFPTFPEEGSQVPNFTFNNVRYYKNGKLNLNEFRGKWLIIEFFSKGCVPCFKSFPKLNELQKEFKDSVQFLLIGTIGGEPMYWQGLDDIYEKHRIKYKLDLPVTYDSVIWKRFEPQGSSSISIIDPAGINQINSIAASLSRENIRAILKGNIRDFARAEGERNQRPDSVFFPGRYDTSTVSFRSMFGRYNNKILQDQSGWIDAAITKGCVYEIGMPLIYFFKLAYVGQSYWKSSDSLYKTLSVKPIIECRDTSLFVDNYEQLNNLYNYSLLVPKEKLSREFLMNIMQRDLVTYFNAVAKIEKRSVPCWKLVLINKNKLTAKNRIRTSEKRWATNGYITQNTTIEKLINMIRYYNSSQPNILDGTGFTDTFDIKLDVLMTDMEEVNAGLRKHGLQMIKENRLMDALVIKDIQ